MLEKAFIISFIVMAIWGTMLNGMIFGKLGNYIVNSLPEWISKPLCDCFFCMTAWYGTAIYWIIWGNSGKEWVIVVILAMGINITIGLLTKLIKTE